MPRIYIDFETRGTIDLKLCGVHVYAAHPDTEILMCAVKVEDGPVGVWWPKESFPHPVWEPRWTVVSHNAPFERAMWWGKMDEYSVPLINWEDTAARAAMCGLPRSLDGVTKALDLAHTKDDEGYRLMLQMCKPKRLSKKELLALAAELGLPAEQAEAEMKFILDRLKVDPEAPGYLRQDYRRFYKWKEDEVSLQRLAEYCKADVMAEYELDKVLPTMPAQERRVWELDQKINDRGIKVDVAAARNAIALIAKHEDALTQELQALTGGAVKTAKQSAALAQYLGSGNVTKQTILDTLLTEEDPVKRRVMEIRQSLGQSSVAKFQALLQATGSDGRMRGMFMYHGAATGRWSGKGFQPQNLPRGNAARFENPDDIIAAMELRDPAIVDIIWGDPIEAAANCLRGMLVAEAGKSFAAADFASIEGRGLAWVAGEEHVLQGYREGLDPYKVDAAAIYRVAYKEITKPQRQVGKTANLACGYMGGVAAMKRFGADRMGLSDEELQDIVTKWRTGRPATVQLWKDLDDAAMRAVQFKTVAETHGIRFGIKGPYLCMKLPSGRLLRYYAPRIENVVTPWGGTRDAVTVMTVNSMTKQWVRRPMHGGLWTENLIQALCRDLLAEAMLRLDERGFDIVMHVHDEVVVERHDPCVVELETFMSEVPTWAAGFPISAAGWKGQRFKKD